MTGGPPATARTGSGPAFVVEADEYAGNFDAYRPDIADPHRRRVGPPRRVRRRGRRQRRVRGVAAPDAGRRRPSSRTSATRAPRRSSTGSATRPLRLVAYALVDDSPQRGGYVRGIRERFATAAGPATAVLGRVIDADQAGTTLEVYGLDELAGALDGPARRPPAATTPPTPSPSPGRPRALGLSPAAIAARPRDVRRRRPPPRAQGRGGRRRGLRRLRPPPDGHPRDPRGRPPARARPARLGGLRAADLPPDRGDARRPSPTPWPGADAVAIADIWAGRDRDTTIVSAAALADAVARRPPGHPGPRARVRRGDRGRARARGPCRRRGPRHGRRRELSHR